MESVLIGLALAAICIFVLRLPHNSAAKAALKTAQAEVVSRRSERPQAALPTQWGGRMQYLVTFCVEQAPLELNVSGSQYARLVEGSRVQLRWRDNTLVDFEAL